MRLRGGFHGHRIIVRNIALLQLSDPAPALGEGQGRIAGEMMFKLDRLDESVGRGRTVGCCQKWEFELVVSFLKVIHFAQLIGLG